MAGFVATENDNVTEAVIANNGFFPSIDPANFRAVARQDKTVTAERLRECLVLAMASVNRQLASFQADKVEAGFTTLDDVSSDSLDGKKLLVMLYQRAVYATAKAELLERYQDFDATNTKQKQDGTQEGEQHNWRRDARWAISDIQGQPRSTVELV